MDDKPWNASTFRQEQEEKQQKKNDESRRENKGFTQVYPQGWWRLKMLMDDNPAAAKLYMFFAEHMDNAGVLVATRETLAEAMGVSVKSISRWSAYLEEKRAIVTMRLGPGAKAYAVNPEEVWKAWDTNKPYAPFHTKTLVGKRENQGMKRRLTHYLGERAKPKQPDLFSVNDEWDPLSQIAEEGRTQEAAE